MERYDYCKEVANDIINWMDDKNNNFQLSNFEDKEEAGQYLNDMLWADSSITGNGPIAYASDLECEEYICHNLDLVFAACDCFGISSEVLRDHLHEHKLGIYLDCLIRCYVLGEAIDMALAEYESYGETYKNE